MLGLKTRYGTDKVVRDTDKEFAFKGGKFHPSSGGQGKFLLLPDPFGRETVIKSTGEPTKNAIYNTVNNAYYAHMAKFATPKNEGETPEDWHDHIASQYGPQALQEAVADMKRECVFDAKGWLEARDGILHEIQLARYTRDQAARQLLLQTEKRKLVYEQPRDTEFSLNNRLGESLMKVREQIRKDAEKKAAERKAQQPS